MDYTANFGKGSYSQIIAPPPVKEQSSMLPKDIYSHKKKIKYGVNK